MGVWGLGVLDLGFRVKRVLDLGFRGFGLLGFGFRGFGLRLRDFGFRI